MLMAEGFSPAMMAIIAPLLAPPYAAADGAFSPLLRWPSLRHVYARYGFIYAILLYYADY